MFKIFGKEPALVLGLISSVITVLVAFNLPVSADLATLIMAFTSAAVSFVVAWRTKHTTLAVVLGLFQAVFALTSGFGWSLSPEQTGTLLLAITAAYTLYNRQTTSPVDAVPGDATVEPSPA